MDWETYYYFTDFMLHYLNNTNGHKERRKGKKKLVDFLPLSTTDQKNKWHSPYWTESYSLNHSELSCIFFFTSLPPLVFLCQYLFKDRMSSIQNNGKERGSSWDTQSLKAFEKRIKAGRLLDIMPALKSTVHKVQIYSWFSSLENWTK